MRFLLDEATPISLVEVLTRAGHQAEHVNAVGLTGSADAAVVAAAQARGAILISPDLGFADERSFPPGSHHGIIVLRVRHGKRPAEMLKSFATRLAELDETDIVGNIVIMEPDRARIRRKE